jgi:hypothetical protein
MVQPGRSPEGVRDSGSAPEHVAGLADTLPTLPGVRPTLSRSPLLAGDLAAPVGQAHATVASGPISAPNVKSDAAHAAPRPRGESARLTRRLADDPARAAPDAPQPLASSDDPQVATRPPRPERLGTPSLALRVALAHACVVLFAALAASVLLLHDDALGYWLLGLVALALPGAVLAWLLLQHSRRSVRVSAALLVTTELAALAWAFMVLGPRPELVLLVPSGVWLAHRLGGRPIALCAGLGSAALAACFTLGAFFGVYQPVISLDASGTVVLAFVAAVLGVGLALWAVLGGAAAREQSDLAARARLYEVRLLRAEMSRSREHIEHETQVLGNALVAALHGKGIEPITVDGPLSPVAEIANVVAERLSTLQKDREDRIRQEGALRMVITAMERGWLDLPWTWPEPSGTPVDDLVALLRTPRTRERRGTAGWLDEFPTLVPLPSLPSSSGHWRSPFWPSDPSLPSHPGNSAPDMSQGRIGWDDLLGGK